MPEDHSHAVYRGLAAVGVPRVGRLIQRGASVLCFHNVVPADDVGQGDRSLHMDVRVFERLVDWVSEAYRIVPLSELIERTRTARPVRGLMALTFDDANRGFLRYGLPVLASREIPCTAFVVSAMATDPRAFWWDVLGQRGALTAVDREAHLVSGRGLASAILGGADEHTPTVPETYLPADWEELEAALRAHPTLTVGAHTRRHPNLTRLSAAELEEELVGARRAIAERLERAPDVLSYPYGLHDGNVREATARAGYLAGLTLEPGSWTSRTDPMRIPRLNIPASIGVSAFECWLAGIKPRGRS